jgi:DNA-directed RNA polymerase alpha subunit
MNPRLSEMSEENNVLTFVVNNMNVSLANGIRRIILSDIPNVVFRAFPHEKNNVHITKNTSRLNNEIIKQRMSCVPIHIKDVDFPIKDHTIEINKSNDGNTIEHVTTGDIKILNTKNGKYLDAAATKKIFPPDPITNYYIDITRLRPRLSDTLPGEKLSMNCKLSIGNAKENSSFNVVSTCSYGAVVDPVKVNAAWTDKAKKLKKENKTPEEIEFIRKDWLLLDAKRLTVPNAFKFVVESVGVFSNMSIVEKGIQIMLNKLNKFSEDLQSKENMINTSKTTIPNSFDIILEGEDYTLGKVIEYILYAKHYDRDSTTSDKTLTYCGFIKPHPHIDISIIRVAFKEPIETDAILTYLIQSANDATQIYLKIKEDFSQ